MSRSLRDSFTDIPVTDPLYVLLANFQTRDDRHIALISHLDRSPVADKIRSFLIPLAMNLLLAGIVAWRTLFYTTGIFSLLGSPKQSASWPSYLFACILDLLIYVQIPLLLRTFITGHLWMRLRCGFRPVEIVLRKPTGSARSNLTNLPPPASQKAYMNSISRAIDAEFLSSTVGFNTRIGPWVLEYPASIEAYKLVDEGRVPLERFDVSVWQKFDERWAVWAVAEEGRVYASPEFSARMPQIVVGKLQAMGKQELLVKWAMFMQEFPDANLEGPTLAKQEEMIKMFKEDGVDFWSFWQEATEEAMKLSDPLA